MLPRQLLQVASIVTCAAALVGAAVISAPHEAVAGALDAPGMALARTLEHVPSPPLTAPSPGRQFFTEDAAEGAVTAATAVTGEDITLHGWVVGDAPGHGKAWAVEAYQLTPDRGAVIACRRVYVEPDGRLRLTNLDEGLWQTALVSPRFAWGPLVDTTSPPKDLRIGADGTGEVSLNTQVDGAAPRGVPLRVSLTAVRSPALADSAVTVQRRLATHDVLLGETVTLHDVSEGTYEVNATIVGRHPEWGLRPRSRRALVTVRPGRNHIDLAFDVTPLASHLQVEVGAAAAGQKTPPR